MTINNINTFILISEAKSFGINTDPFETNILNLSVVIAVLVYYGKLVISDIIKSRKETILKNLQDAENKFREAEENLSSAKRNFEIAKTKSEQIRQQGSMLAEQTSTALLTSADEEIKRLKAINLSSIKIKEERAIREVCQKLTQQALTKAVGKVSRRLNPSLRKKINSRKIEKLSRKVFKK